MGATNSTSTNIQTILEEETNNIVTEVLTKNSTSVSVSQEINIRCDNDVYNNIAKLCAEENKYYAEMNSRVVERGFVNPNLTVKQGTSVCDLCSATNINQNAVVNISTDNTTTDKIANDIKAEMVSKLQKEIDNKSDGALFSDNSTNLTNLSDIKKSVENNFKNTVVRETILNYSYSQTTTSNNAKISNVNQTIVASGISKNIISNLMDTDQSFKSAIESLDKIKNKETNVVGVVGETASDVAKTIGNTVTGVTDSLASMFGSIWIVILIIGVVIFIMFKDIILCLPPLAFTPLCKSNSSTQQDGQSQYGQ